MQERATPPPADIARCIGEGDEQCTRCLRRDVPPIGVRSVWMLPADDWPEGRRPDRLTEQETNE